MFKTKYVICTILFITFLVVTSFVKNKSRLLEKQITNLNIEIISKENTDERDHNLNLYIHTENEKKIKLLKKLNKLIKQKYTAFPSTLN